MKIAFIGACHMEAALGKHWSAKGREFCFFHSRHKDKLKEAGASVSSDAQIGTALEAASLTFSY